MMSMIVYIAGYATMWVSRLCYAIAGDAMDHTYTLVSGAVNLITSKKEFQPRIGALALS